MSRKNAKMCKIHDLQNRYPDVILTKKDCDMITKALYSTYVDNKNRNDKDFQLAFELARYFKELTYKHKLCTYQIY